MTAPTLVFAWGNQSRGDDALGPELAQRLEQTLGEAIDAGQLEVLTDYQLQVEHTLDLVGRDRVFFVDATTSCSGPYSLTKVAPEQDQSFTTHALTPGALLHAYTRITEVPLPECWLLAIRGQQFELGAPMTPDAVDNLNLAFDTLRTELQAQPTSASRAAFSLS